jgi:hypothetical protein
MPSTPQLGTPVPGTTGGLPAVSGLSVMQNPMAQQLQSMGRGEDSMLVHMTPGEVNSLQGLAMAAGGSLTINPQTGLPEASFLKKLLPMIAGIGLNFILPGSGLAIKGLGTAAQAGLMTGAASTAITGDLSKGLMAGLGAFGGASLAGGAQAAFGAGAKTAAAGVPPIPVDAAAKVATATPGAQATLPGSVLGMKGSQVPAALMQSATQDAALKGGIQISPSLSKALAGPIKTPGTLGRFGQGFAETARGDMTGLAGKAAPYVAGMGVLNTLSEATAPQMPRYNSEDDDFQFTPMGPGVREVRFQTPEQVRESGGREFKYFTPTNPDPVPLYERPRGFAEGGTTAAPPQGFDELVQYFGSTNPGAITAPNAYPSATPAPRGETVHNFRQPGTTARNLGIADGTGPYGTFGSFNAADYDAAISRLRNDLGLGSPSRVQPSAPPIMPAPPQQAPGNSGFGGGFDEQRPVLDSVSNDYDFRGYVPDFAPPIMPAPPQQSPGNSGFGGGFDEQRPVLDSILNDFDFRGYVPDFARTFPQVEAPAPMPVTQPSIRPAPDAPPIMSAPSEGMGYGGYNPFTPEAVYQPGQSTPNMLSPFEDMDYGGPYYTTIPTMPQVEEEAVYENYNPGYGSGGGGGGGRGMFDEFRVDQYAKGGEVHIDDGGFILSAREAAELGKGDTLAAHKAVAPYGGIPLIGPGNGTSDSIAARIGGTQKARVASGEIYFPFDAVKRIGGGDHNKGTKKLYALMRKAEQSRKNTPRGEDGPDLMRGLA